MAWGPITVGGESFSDTDFAPFAYAATWERLLAAFAQHLTDTAALAGVQTATVTATAHGGGVTTYTYTSPTEPPDGGALWLDVPETPQGTVSLARSGGATRTLRNSDGSVLGEGQITPGRLYLAKRVSGVFELVSFDLIQWVFSRDNRVGASATIDGRLTRAGSVLTRLGGFSTGDFWAQVDDGAGGLTTAFWVYGAGTAGRAVGDVRCFANLDVDLDVNIDGDAVLDGALSVGGDATVTGDLTVSGSIDAGSPIYTEANPPSVGDAIIQLMQEFGGTGAYESLQEARSVPNTHPRQIYPSDWNRAERCNVNGAFYDLGDMLPNEEKRIQIVTAGTVRIWTGELGVNFTDRTQPQVIVSKGRYRVHRGNGNEWEIEAVNGKTITDADLTTYPLPTYARRIPVLGYSNSVRTIKNMAGWRDQALAWGDNPSVVNIVSGVGASCFLEGGESGFVDGNAATYNHWWKWRTSAPGPNMQVFLDAVAAQPSSPAMEFCIVHLGYPDMNLWQAARNPLSAALTEKQMIQHWADALTWLKGASGLNLPSLKFVICPMAHRHVAVWDRKLWYAMRRMMVGLCAAHPTLAVRGPPSFDLRYIPADGHPTIDSQRIFSARWYRWTETLAGRRGAYLGPEIESFEQEDATTTHIVIDSGLDDTYADGAGEALVFPGETGNWLNAPRPPGLDLLPARALLGDGSPDYITDNPIAISKAMWDYNGTTKRYTVTLIHADHGLGVRPCWPYGFCNEFGENPARCIRSLLTGEPLAEFHPDIRIPKVVT